MESDRSHSEIIRKSNQVLNDCYVIIMMKMAKMIMVKSCCEQLALNQLFIIPFICTFEYGLTQIYTYKYADVSTTSPFDFRIINSL